MVQENIKKFGIYFSSQEMKVVRINSPYWFPPEPGLGDDHQRGERDAPQYPRDDR